MRQLLGHLLDPVMGEVDLPYIMMVMKNNRSLLPRV
jgi:hypothetical protein